MTHYEVQVISTTLFEKSLETKSFQRHIKKMKDKKQMRFIDDPESQITNLMPNLMKLVMIDNPD